MTLEERNLNKHMGQKIKYYRERYNLGKPNRDKITQEKLAEMVNVSTGLIGSLESEKKDQGCSIYTLWKISKALHVSIEQFVWDSTTV